MPGLKVKFSRKQICHCPSLLSFCQMGPMGFDLHLQGLAELYSPRSQAPLSQQWSWDGNLLVPSLWILEEYVYFTWSKILLPTENDSLQHVTIAEGPCSESRRPGLFTSYFNRGLCKTLSRKVSQSG